MSDLYTDLTTIKDELVLTDSAQDDRLERAIEDASRAIDAFCRVEPGTFAPQGAIRTFDVPPANLATRALTTLRITDNTRLVTTQALRVPPLLSITTLKTDENNDGVYETTWTAGTDFLLYPLNQEVKREVQPNVDIGRYAFPTGQAKVQILGLWGVTEDGATPLPIRRACLLQAMRYYRDSDSTGTSGQKAQSLGGAWANFGGIDPDVAAILRSVAGKYTERFIAA